MTEKQNPQQALPAHQERTEPMEFPNWPPLSGVEITDLLKSVPAGPFREKALHALHAHDGLRGVFTDSELTRAGQNWTDDLPRAPRPDFWRCLTCGCLWRDNHDETVSLASDKQTSCAECEMKGTLTTCEPLYRAAPARAAEWQPLTKGAELIATERQRQITAEGWTDSHDDEHSDNELAQAARCYLWGARQLSIPLASERLPLDLPVQPRSSWNGHVAEPGSFDWPVSAWPWESSWWKPGTDPIRCLVIAGALIAAEIDRLNRALPPAPSRARRTSDGW